MKEFSNYTRVTDVLFPFSGLKDIDPNILKNAAERGTKVHEICDALMSDLGVMETGSYIQGYIESFHKWLPKKFINKPSRFYCDKYMITGECDGIYEEDNKLILIDIKTPLNESKSWRLQGSAYSYLAKQSGYEIKRIEFIKLSKEGQAPKVYVYEESFDLFLKCLDVYNYFFKNKTSENNNDYL